MSCSEEKVTSCVKSEGAVRRERSARSQVLPLAIAQGLVKAQADRANLGGQVGAFPQAPVVNQEGLDVGVEKPVVDRTHGARIRQAALRLQVSG